MATKVTQVERMRARRAAMTDEQREANRVKARERMRRRRAAKAKSRPPKEPAAPKPRPTAQERRNQSNVRLARMLDGTPLTDTQTVIAFLRATYPNANTRRTYLANLIGAKRDDDDFPAAALAAYRQEMNGLILSIRTAYGENTRSDRDLKGWVSWDDLVSARARCDREGPTRDRVLFALYMDTPPRRAEYATLRVRRDFPPADDTGNWVVVPEGEDIVCVTLGTYKTVKKYGRQTLDGSRFARVLHDYVATLDDGAYLFSRGYRTSSGWSNLLGATTKKWAGRRATVNIFRKSFVSHLARARPSMTTNARGAVASEMGTSLGMLDTVYRKVS